MHGGNAARWRSLGRPNRRFSIRAASGGGHTKRKRGGGGWPRAAAAAGPERRPPDPAAAGRIPVTLRHAGGARYPAEPARLWQNEGFRIGKRTCPAAGAQVTVELLSVIIARRRAAVKLVWR